MRTALLALALVTVACGGNDGQADTRAAGVPSVASNSGPDELALRVPREGGVPHVSTLPGSDSTVWTAEDKSPGLARILAFDENAGVVVAVSQDGEPVRIDFRRGTVTRERKPELKKIASADGWAIYGITDKGSVARLTPVDETPWTFKPPVAARNVLPQPDGSLMIVADSASHTLVWRLRPPETVIVDRAMLPASDKAVRTQIGDRVYFPVKNRLIGLSTRNLERVPEVKVGDSVSGVVPSPSGDRLYIITGPDSELVVADRYREDIAERIELPGSPKSLRMDPTGRFVLVRAAEGDSVWVVGVGSDRITGAVKSEWREDLPTVTPDGEIALVQGKDVVFVNGVSLQEKSRIKDGAKDVWFFFSWDGFRPIVANEERVDTTPGPMAPDTNPFAGQLATQDTSLFPPLARSDTAPIPVPPAGGVFAPPPPPPAGTDTASTTEFTLQFAAVRDESAARDLAREISAGPASPRVAATTRVVTTQVAGSTVYRVIAGPFRTRQEADAAGQQTGKPYWVYAGAP